MTQPEFDWKQSAKELFPGKVFESKADFYIAAGKAAVGQSLIVTITIAGANSDETVIAEPSSGVERLRQRLYERAVAYESVIAIEGYTLGYEAYVQDAALLTNDGIQAIIDLHGSATVARNQSGKVLNYGF